MTPARFVAGRDVADRILTARPNPAVMAQLEPIEPPPVKADIMTISHYMPDHPGGRLLEPLRFEVYGGAARSVRFLYRHMRREGVSAFWARHYTITLLRAGRYDTQVVDAKRQVTA